MTDRTHPDSGRVITSGDLLLHDAKTALMYEELRAAIDDGHESMTHADALAEIAAIRAENTMLRQHAAKQITDATLLTGISPRNGGMDIGLEGGACQLLAEAFFDQFVEAGAVNFLEVRLESSTRMPGKAMTVTMQLADGVTPGQKIAEANARIAELEAQLDSIGAGGVSGPLMGSAPEGITRDDTVHGETYFTAADMASASAQGFRYGVASLAANAGSEPVAYAMFADNGNIRLWSKARIPHPDAKPLYLHPSPPEGMVGGWMPIETAPIGRDMFIVRAFDVQVTDKIFGYTSDAYGVWQPTRGRFERWPHPFEPTHWMPLPPPPTSSADSRKGE